MVTYFNKKAALLLVLLHVIGLAGCSTMKSIFKPGDQSYQSKPIDNPFGNFYEAQKNNKENYTFRTKQGDRSVEFDMPANSEMTDLVVPMNHKFEQNKRTVNANELDYTYSENKPSLGDREIASTFPNGNPEEEMHRRNVERALGLEQTDELPNMDQSYLAKVDVVKQLFKNSRFEAALIETDTLIRAYPTNPKLYEMRGSIMDRMGYPDLALRSWKQALEFQPTNIGLKRIIERKQAVREIASERK